MKIKQKTVKNIMIFILDSRLQWVLSWKQVKMLNTFFCKILQNRLPSWQESFPGATEKWVRSPGREVSTKARIFPSLWEPGASFCIAMQATRNTDKTEGLLKVAAPKRKLNIHLGPHTPFRYGWMRTEWVLSYLTDTCN